MIEINTIKTKFDWNRFRKVNKLFPEEKDISFLDIGCGRGEVLKSVNYKYKSGLDFNNSNLSQAKNNLPYANFYLTDIMDFKTDKRYGLIYAGEIIEHVTEPDKFLTKCYDLLEDGGTMVLDTPNICALYKRLKCMLGINPQPPSMHIQCFTKRSLVSIAKDVGFEIEVASSDKITNIGRIWFKCPFDGLSNHIFLKLKKPL